MVMELIPNVNHLAELKKGRYAWGKFRDENNEPPQLAGIDLSSGDRAGPFLWNPIQRRANLGCSNEAKDGQRLNFENAKFDGSNLSNVNLAGAILTGASLKGCNLSGAILNGANLCRSSWTGTILTRAELEWASFEPDCKLKEEADAKLNNNELLEKFKEEAAADMHCDELRAKLYDRAKDGWRRLKNNWLEMGKYDEASEAAMREKRAARKAMVLVQMAVAREEATEKVQRMARFNQATL